MGNLIQCWGDQYMLHNDGGRGSAGFKGDTRDCGLRAICIATGRDYAEVRKALMNDVEAWAKTSRSGAAKRRAKKGNSVFTGINKTVFKKFMEKIGWSWTPTMSIGSGCRVHLRADELPRGILICSLSRHFTVVINGVINDTFDPSREGKRCVYGYWQKKNQLTKLRGSK